MMSNNRLNLFWGCDPSRQYEKSWLMSLLDFSDITYLQSTDISVSNVDSPLLVVESGILRLEHNPAPERLDMQHRLRQQYINLLQVCGPILLVHLSDEEGLDGDILYPLLPPNSIVWRNFPYPRFDNYPKLLIRNFPIGPRSEFLDHPSFKPASTRHFPWSFMGTLWRSGQRMLATSLFLHKIPNGFYFGGRRFGMGLPLPEYRHYLESSVFALCPEGDRHFDTFRLYESLQLGCLPLVVERQHQAASLLGQDFPLPIFSSWHDALTFAHDALDSPPDLDNLQIEVSMWWSSKKSSLSLQLVNDLMSLH